MEDRFHLDYSPIALRHGSPSLPVLDELVDPVPQVKAEAVANLCGSATVPRPVVPEPSCRWIPEAPTERVPEAPAAPAWIDELCQAAVGDLPRPPFPNRGVDVAPFDRAEGEVEVVHLGDPGPDSAYADAQMPKTVDALRRIGVEAWLVKLGPGGAVAALAPSAAEQEGPEWLVVSLVTPGGAAGVTTSAGTAPAVLGRVVGVGSAEAVHLWNDASEPTRFLVVALTPTSARRRPFNRLWGRRRWVRGRTRPRR